jgi:hypothetical protein
MPLFKPNLDCNIVQAGGHDGYGQVMPGTSHPERCAIIKLESVEVKSAVRADSSASRGAAMELQAKAHILLEATTVAQLDDIIEVNGLTLRISQRFPRHSLRGVIDHVEIHAVEWSAAP